MKLIPEFEDYAIREDGVVWSLKGQVPVVIAPWPCNAYVKVTLCREGKESKLYVHRLVLLTYVGKPPSPDAQARHLDGNPLNNRVGNLQWGTREENMADMVRHGRAGRTRLIPEQHGNCRLSDAQVAEIRAKYRPGVFGAKARLALEYGVTQSHIGRLLSGQSRRPLV